MTTAAATSTAVNTKTNRVDKASVAVVLVIMASAVTFWAAVELDGAEKDPLWRGWSGNTLIVAELLVWGLARLVIEFLRCSEGDFGKAFRVLKHESQVKTVVHIGELIAGSVLAIVLLWLFVRINITHEPDDCSLNYIGLDVRLLRTACSLPDSPDVPKVTAEGFLLVAPGTNVQYLSQENAAVLSTLRGDCHVLNAFAVEICFAILTALYFFEMAFEGSYMRPSLLLHHVVTMGVVFTIIGLPPNTLHFVMVYVHVVMACLEQPTFLALVAYRLFPDKIRLHAKLLKVAWISFAINKTIAQVGSLFFLIKYWDEAAVIFIALFMVLTTGGVAAQIYSTYAQFLLWKKAERKLHQITKAVSEDEVGSKESKNIVIT